MRYLKTYQLFEAKTGLTKEQEEWLDKCTEGRWTYNPKTGLVDVDGDFNCIEQGLSDFKGVRFGEVGGTFSCEKNQLTTLEGAPRKVKWSFMCSHNRLTTLEGAPQKVGGYFSCEKNQLTTLEGAPRKVKWSFECSHNRLTTLEGAPREVGGGFYCKENPVSEKTLKSIFGIMESGKSYLEATEYLWDEIPLDDQALLYRSEFEWVGIQGLLKILKEGSSKSQELILKFLSPEVLNVEIQKDPAGMIMKLKEVWNDESFKEIRSKLVWPKGYEEEAGLVGDLDDVGF